MPRTIVFIDGLVYDKDYLVSQFSSDIEYHVLDQNVDGISQMLEVLAGRSGFDSIQIISHGSPGSLTLGSTVLDNSSIGGYSSQLYTLGSSLNATGDLLLYGCGVGAGDVGRAFVDALAAATGADVAASDDATSGSAVGGDWELEVQAGDIAQAFSVLPSQYPFVLSSTADPVTSSTLLFPGHSMGQWSNAYAFAAIREDGSVVTWGDSRYGGDSTGVATQLNGYYDVIKVYSTNYAFAALREDGKVITWGLDSAGGNSVDTDLTKVVEVFSTHYAFAALREDGSVVAWSKGSCCGADTFPVASKLNGDIDVVEVFSTYEAFAALREDGSVVTWGDSTYGGGGNGLTALDGTTNVVQVFSTYGAFAALREDGSVVTWGNVSWGGNSSSVASKLDGSDDSRDVVQVFSTAYAFAALREDGSVVTWGNVSRGGNSSSVASKLDGSDDSRDVVQVFSTAYAFAALREDGSVVTWGHSVSGGDSSSVADELDGDVDVVDIFSDGGAFAALREDGSVVTWGASDWGGNSSSVADELDGDVDVVNIFSTDKAFAALRADGSVVTWGDSSYGGDSSSVASKLDGTVDVVRLFSTKCGSSTSGGAFAALREDGSVVVWGAFSYGGGLYVGMETELHDVVDISHIGADWLSGLLESEPNGTFATANVIVFGEAITGQIATSDDLDVYMLTASEAGVASISFDAPTNSSLRDYFIVNVFDADGTVLSSQSAGKDFSFQTSLPEAGDYYVGINAGDWYHDAGQYNLTVTTKSLDNNGYEYEPNDEYANILVSGLVKRGKLATAYDIDRFQLQTTDAGSLTIHFDAPTTNTTISSYFYIHVFDEDANLLARRACNQDVDFEVNAPEAGNYVVEITHGAYYDPGEYALKVTETVGTVLRESEINDSQETADTMSLDESIHGQLSLFNDKDYFAFTMGASGNITIDFDGPSNSTWINYFAIELLDESGTLLASRDTGSDVSLETTVDAAGVYYIKIERSNDFHNDGEYRITVSAILDEPVPDNALKGTPFGDSITGTSGDDLIYGLGGNDLINGLDGSDTVVFRASSAHLSINTVQGLTTVRGDYGAGEYAYSVSRLWNVENLKTQSGTEALSSMSVTPLLGTVAGEVIRGTTADDLIDGLGGSDFIDGGEGNDTLALFGAKSHFMVLTVAGITRIQGSDATNEYAGHTLKTINVENLAFNQNQTCLLQTTSANKIFGTQSADRLTGTNGDDVFDGQGGNDQIDGGAGNDTIAIFGKMADFTMTYPSETDDRLLIQGKTGTPYARQTLTATNIESIAFVDNTIAVTNPPKVVLSPASLNVAEGGTTSSLSVALSAKPTSTVSVNINTGSQLSASSMQLTFDSTNWSTPQTVTVSAVDDATYEKQHSGMLTVSVQTSDSLYAGLTNSTLNYTISDNDTSNLGAVSGKFWNDFDKDGLMESRETALSGWTVFDDKNSNGKLDSGEVSGTTGLDGYYVLEDLTPGSHTIVAKVNNGWTPTYSNHSAASATIITNTGSDGEVSVETLSSEEVSETAAQETYSNLGRATNIAAYHADSRFADINGQGYSVVVIDTGIDLDHSYFGADSNHDGISDRIVYSYDFYGKDDNNASDGQGHGAHVAGIIGSSNVNFPGVAPEVNIIALKVFPDGDGGAFNYDIIQALNWVVQNTTRYNIAAVNLSLGDGQFNTTSTIGYCSSQLKSLANIGVTVVSASGNGYAEYQKQGVSYPSSDPYSLSVGAVWTGSGTWGSLQTGVPDAIAFFSQRDDELSDIFAPGVLIYSAENNGDVIQMSGTSMASPEIAGMVALGQQLAEQELGRRLTFNEVHDLLYQTGNDIVDGDDENDVVPNTGLTFKRVDMLAFAEAILELKPLVSQTVTITAGTTVIDKNFGFAATTDVQALGADDLIIGTTWGEIIRGGAGADQISSGDGDDELYGEDGNDLLKLEGGDNYVDGGNGFDIVQYAGVYADYHYSYDIATDTWTVQRAIDDSAEGTGNTDTITGMELFRFAGEEGDDDHPAEAHDCTVDVTYWKSGAAIEGVTSCLTDTGNDQERTCLTDGTGKSDFTGLIQAEYELEALKTVDDSLVDTVQVSDALAALKIAFGVNPNGGGSEVSNYEYIAADVNQDGTVKASDALAILKMAIGFNKAQEHEWLFVSDDIAEVVMSRTNVDWSEVALDITITSDTQIDLIGIVKGDVNGSWTPEAA